MAWFYMFLALGLASQVWLGARVARSSSVPWAVATLLLGAPAAAYPLFKQSGEARTRLTLPFAANLALMLLVAASGVVLLANRAGHEAEVRAAAAAESDKPAAALGTAALTSLNGSGSMPQLVPSEPVDALANELRAVGITSTIVRLPPTAKLPPGVLAAAQIDMSGRSSGNAPALSATFLTCDAAATCSSVARAYMLQAPASRPRVLQNGAMVLLVAGARSVETENFYRTVAGTFRQLPRPQP